MQSLQDDPVIAATIAVVQRFNEATSRHDVDAMMAAMTDDVVFESTSPPGGERREGQAAVRAVWHELFRASPEAALETEELFAAGDRCVVRWLYRWTGQDGKPGHVRGVDVFRVREGKIAEKLSYVKG
ncbi:MAG TPA: nuclear transport factor 2 family protein [Chloroflexota bacterium]|nr:nuclear transport factor 2 family protein [Chloroflexota bacterium]